MKTETHIKDCELGDNWKDCPACLETAIHVIHTVVRSRMKEAKRKLARNPGAVTYQDHFQREWRLGRSIHNIRCGLLPRRKKGSA